MKTLIAFLLSTLIFALCPVDIYANGFKQSAPDTIFANEDEPLTLLATNLLDSGPYAMESYSLKGSISDHRWHLQVGLTPARWLIEPTRRDINGIFVIILQATQDTTLYEKQFTVVVRPKIDLIFSAPLEINPIESQSVSFLLSSALADPPLTGGITYEATALDGISARVFQDTLLVSAIERFSGQSTVLISATENSTGYRIEQRLSVTVGNWIQTASPDTIHLEEDDNLSMSIGSLVTQSTVAINELVVEVINIVPPIAQVTAKNQALHIQSKNTGAAQIELDLYDQTGAKASMILNIIVHPLTKLIQHEIEIPLGTNLKLQANEFFHFGDTTATSIHFKTDRTAMSLSNDSQFVNIIAPSKWYGSELVSIDIASPRSNRTDHILIKVNPPTTFQGNKLELIHPSSTDTIDLDKGESIAYFPPPSPIRTHSVWISADDSFSSVEDVGNLFAIKDHRLDTQRLLDAGQVGINHPFYINIAVITNEGHPASSGWFSVVLFSGVPLPLTLDLPEDGAIVEDKVNLQILRPVDSLAVGYEFFLKKDDTFEPTYGWIHAENLAEWEKVLQWQPETSLQSGKYTWFARTHGKAGRYTDTESRSFVLFRSTNRSPTAWEWFPPGRVTFSWEPFPVSSDSIFAEHYEFSIEQDGTVNIYATEKPSLALDLKDGYHRWKVKAIYNNQEVFIWEEQLLRIGGIGAFYAAPTPAFGSDPIVFYWEAPQAIYIADLRLQIYTATGRLLADFSVDAATEQYEWNRNVSNGTLNGPAVALLKGKTVAGDPIETFTRFVVYP